MTSIPLERVDEELDEAIEEVAAGGETLANKALKDAPGRDVAAACGGGEIAKGIEGDHSGADYA